MQIKRVVERIEDVPGLGDRIRQARKAHKSSLIKLAASVGISRQHWYKIEAESLSYPLPLETLRAIEKALGVDFDVFKK
jgi:transcriptional regulator with XRE-family HTH domain